MPSQIGPGVEEINATLRNLRRQKDFEVTLKGIDAEYKKAMKKNYYQWLETLHQLRHEKQVGKGVQYFSEKEWRSSRKSLMDIQNDTLKNMQSSGRKNKNYSSHRPTNHAATLQGGINKSDLELL